MFASDNAAGVHPAILDAIARASLGNEPSYGADALTQRVEARFRDIFETDCSVFLVGTGTAANALALAALTPPWGAVVCHRHAHIEVDEAGAPEFFTGGAKLLLAEGVGAKVSPATFGDVARKYRRDWVHGAQPCTLSISQSTECGTCYAAEEVGALAEEARRRGYRLHMDGARFANALASLSASPAEMTWRAGVSALSFGATKNGAMGVEAVVSFDAAVTAQLPHLRKRAGHLFSKHRFLAAQMDAYLADGLWLGLAAHANAVARALGEAFGAAGCPVAHPVDANAVFVRLGAEQAARLSAAGARFHPWPHEGPEVYRFVASWTSSFDEVAVVRRALQAAAV